MRVRWLLVLGGLAGGLVAACSSGTSAPLAPVDAGIGGGAGLGEPCEPSAAQPCVVVTDVCSVAVCDATSHLCVRVSVDAGPTCGGAGPAPCASGACDGGADDATTEAGEGDGASDGATEAGGDASVDASGESDAGDAGDAKGD